MIMKKKLLFLCFLFTATIGLLQGQERRINGTVIAGDDGTGIPGVTVRVQGSTTATQTDANGRYAINASQGSVLLFQAVGYEDISATVGSSAVVDVTMQVSLTELNEVIINIPYGSTRKSDFTGVATVVGAKDMINRPISNPLQALQGAGPGIQTTAPAGAPGSSPGVTIRGIGSYSANNSALYVVDGVEYSGGMANINPDDVESITVLKDAATIALYGSRGANGVVMVTTKKGTKNKSSLDFKVQFGFNENGVPSYNTVNAGEYYELMWEAYKNNLVYGATPIPADAAAQIASGLMPRNAAGMQTYGGRTYQDIVQFLGNYNAFNVPKEQLISVDGKLNPNAKLIYGDDLDWLNQASRKGKRNEYSLNYSSGNDKSTLYTSLNYLNEEGWGLRSSMERFAFRVNATSDLTKWMRAGMNVSANRNNYNNAASGGAINDPFVWSRGIAPIYPVHVHNPQTGEYILDEGGNKIFDLGNMVAEYGLSRPYNSGRHALAETLWNRDISGRDYIGARAFVEFTILPWLTFHTSLNTDLTNNRLERYENTKVGDGAPAGRFRQEFNRTFSYTFNQYFTAERSFGQHNANLVVGHENFDYNYDEIYGMRAGEGFSDFYTFSNFTDIMSLTSSLSQRAMESYFSRLSYDFNNRYFVSASLRADGDSRMPPANRWSSFWSLGVAWRVDRENWFSSDLFDLLKLRASYGRLGNSNVGTYPYQPGYGINNNAAAPGVVLSSLGSPDLKWEGQNPLDIGVDYSLLRGKITGTIDWYDRRSTGLLFSVTQPYHNGGTNSSTNGGSFAISKNVGDMQNKGFEFSITGNIVRNRDFNWSVTANISRQYNKILKMPEETPELISEPYNRKAGYSIYEFYTRTFYGVDPDNGRVLYKGVTSYTEGNENIKLVQNSSGGTDTLTYDHNLAARSFVGKSALPKGYGSLVNNFTYKNFDLNFVLTYQFGGWIMNSAFMSAGPSNGANLHRDLLDGWRKPGDVTDIPRMDLGQTSQFGASSTRWLTSSNYLSISAINLGYRLPKTATNYLHLKGGRVFVSAENLAFLSKRKGMNPISSLTSTNSGAYNFARTLNFGVNVNL